MTGYLSGNTLVPFPFADGQKVAGTDDMALALQACFADALVHVKAGAADGFAPQDAFLGAFPAVGMVRCEGASLVFSVSAFGSSVQVSASPSGEPFPVVHGEAPFGSYVITVSSEGIRRYAESLFPPLIDPGSVQGFSSSPARTPGYWLLLCARCVEVSPSGLSSLRVYDGVHPQGSGPHFTLSGEISVRGGNNMSVSAEGGAVRLDASPGAGDGRVPCRSGCGGAGRGAIADENGNARIVNDSCYEFEPVRTSPSSATVVLHGKCTACCTCEMYESIVNDRLAALFGDVKDAKGRLDDMTRKYEEGVGDFNGSLKAPSARDFSLSVSGMPLDEPLGSRLKPGAKVKGMMSRCSFTATLRNSSYFEAVVTASSISAAPDTVLQSTTVWTNENGVQAVSTAHGPPDGETYTVCAGGSLTVTFIAASPVMSGSAGYRGHSASASFSVSCRTESGLVPVGEFSRSVVLKGGA